MSVFHGLHHFWRLQKEPSDHLISHSHPSGFDCFMLFVASVCVCLGALLHVKQPRKFWKAQMGHHSGRSQYIQPIRDPKTTTRRQAESQASQWINQKTEYAILNRGTPNGPHTHKDNTLHSQANHNVGTNGDEAKNEGEEKWEMGEATLCMISSSTTGLKGPRLTEDTRTTRLCRHEPAISPIKAGRGVGGGVTNAVKGKAGWEHRKSSGWLEASSIVRWQFAVGGFLKLRRSLKSTGKCSETMRATENIAGWQHF